MQLDKMKRKKNVKTRSEVFLIVKKSCERAPHHGDAQMFSLQCAN